MARSTSRTSFDLISGSSRAVRFCTTRSDRGFTIVELLIVIVVIALLAAISIVAYSGIQGRASRCRPAAIAAGESGRSHGVHLEHTAARHHHRQHGPAQEHAGQAFPVPLPRTRPARGIGGVTDPQAAAGAWGALSAASAADRQHKARPHPPRPGARQRCRDSGSHTTAPHPRRSPGVPRVAVQ